MGQDPHGDNLRRSGLIEKGKRKWKREGNEMEGERCRRCVILFFFGKFPIDPLSPSPPHMKFPLASYCVLLLSDREGVVVVLFKKPGERCCDEEIDAGQEQGG